MVIFHSYVSLPEGTINHKPSGGPFLGEVGASFATVRWCFPDAAGAADASSLGLRRFLPAGDRWGLLESALQRPWDPYSVAVFIAEVSSVQSNEIPQKSYEIPLLGGLEHGWRDIGRL